MKHGLVEVEALVLRFMAGHGTFNETLRHVAAYQRTWVPALAEFWRRRDFDPGTATPESIPAVPTDVFKYARLVSTERPVEITFRTSGTSAGRRGESHRLSTRTYDAGACLHFRRLVPLPVDDPRFISLVFDPEAVPDSSLSHMVAALARERSRRRPVFLLDHEHGIDIEACRAAFSDLDRPAVVFGTAYAFADLVDRLQSPLLLPPGSVLLETGGFKGRRRSIDPDDLYSRLCHIFGLPPSRVRAEYSMTELSSQLYAEASLPRSSRMLVPPPWCRVLAVDPETLAPLPPGEAGLLRFVDLANVDTVVAVQTSDLGVVYPGQRVSLRGRAEGATPRGCSLAAEELLGIVEPLSSGST